MRLVLLAFLTFSLLAHAALITHDHVRNHSQLARRANVGKRCKPKSVAPSPAPKKPAPAPVSTNNTAPANSAKPASGVLSNTIHSSCGPSGATEMPTATGGPNGREDWLNCGLHGSGWNPPFITIDQVISMDIDQAIRSPGSPFQQCSAYISLFKKHAFEHNIPPIMIASFALQESSCTPGAIGGDGEQGLMQLTKDKCGGAPGGNCLDPDFNIATGTKFFADTLASNGGSVLLSIGHYNGWFKGMTYTQATAEASTCCRCQQNTDYIQQFMNGWLQNQDVYSKRIGEWFNLDICGA